jgi:exodeoxyribonuclease V beta subunit
MNELEFTFPVGHWKRGQTVNARQLAEVFREHGSTAVNSAYTERIARLDFLPVAGYLHGYIDLVFEHAGRFYVVDYKSNFLGPAPDDYVQARLVSAMEHHDYFLQYHLYSVAVQKYLRVRVPQYESSKHFGGVFYLFLRGMSPERPTGGVFFDRPSETLLGALLHLFDPAREAS